MKYKIYYRFCYVLRFEITKIDEYLDICVHLKLNKDSESATIYRVLFEINDLYAHSNRVEETVPLTQPVFISHSLMNFIL